MQEIPNKITDLGNMKKTEKIHSSIDDNFNSCYFSFIHVSLKNKLTRYSIYTINKVYTIYIFKTSKIAMYIIIYT